MSILSAFGSAVGKGVSVVMREITQSMDGLSTWMIVLPIAYLPCCIGNVLGDWGDSEKMLCESFPCS